tara:strand:- start:820 stop:1743 length:924 start_codon:yes stop_codon:yes gene_type:complete
MIFKNYFNPKKTMRLVGLHERFNFFKKLILEEKFPQALIFSGDKGLGKSTLIFHLMYYYFDKQNYDEKKNLIIKENYIFKQINENLYPGIIYLNGSKLKNIKIDDVRNLRTDLLKTSFTKKRFIILDDVELFNMNSLNALLKVIEEPGKNNYFILINNQTKPILATIKSRCLEVKLIMSDNEKKQITNTLLNYFKLEEMLDQNLIAVSPGNFLRINHFFVEKKINIEDDPISNLSKILNLYKKEKDIFYRDLLLFFVDYYLIINKSRKTSNSKKFIENRSFVVKNINDFFLYNLSQNTLLNSLEDSF